MKKKGTKKGRGNKRRTVGEKIELPWKEECSKPVAGEKDRATKGQNYSKKPQRKRGERDFSAFHRVAHQLSIVLVSEGAMESVGGNQGQMGSAGEVPGTGGGRKKT